MKNITLSLFLLLHTGVAFSALPEDGIYVLLSSAESRLSSKEILERFYELPRFIIVEGEITDLRGGFFYPSDCNTATSGGMARLDLSHTKVQKKEDGLFFINKEFNIDPEQSASYNIYWSGGLSSDLVTAYSLYGRDVVYGILRFDSPKEAEYSLTSAQAFFTGDGLNVESCITQETARLVKIQ